MHRLIPLFLIAAVVGCGKKSETHPPTVVRAEEVPKTTTFQLDELKEMFPPPKRATPPRKKAARPEVEEEEPEPAPRKKAKRPQMVAEEPEEEAAAIIRTTNKPLKVWEVGLMLKSHNHPGFTLSLPKVELYPGNRTRWYFSVMNRSGYAMEFNVSLHKSFMADAEGNRYEALSDSAGTTRNVPMERRLEDGLRFDYWMDWPAPKPGVTSLNVSLVNDSFRYTTVSFSRFSVHLPEESEDPSESKPGAGTGSETVAGKTRGGGGARASAPSVALTEKFADVEDGMLPTGWETKGDKVAVKDVRRKKGLVLAAKTVDGQVTVPLTELSGKFRLDCEFEIAAPTSSIQFRLKGMSGSPDLLFSVNGERQLGIQDKSKKEIPGLNTGGSKNTLSLERMAAVYVLKVNGTPSAFPLTVANGPFSSLDIILKGGGNSPVIRSVQITLDPK